MLPVVAQSYHYENQRCPKDNLNGGWVFRKSGLQQYPEDYNH